MVATGVTLSNGKTVPTGCYVDSHWGWRGLARMVEIAGDLVGFTSDVPIATDPDGFDIDHATFTADDAERALNDATPEGFVWHWHDGEFFLSPDCGNDDYPEECPACRGDMDCDCACHCW